jgi:hypothetical protein
MGVGLGRLVERLRHARHPVLQGLEQLPLLAGRQPGELDPRFRRHQPDLVRRQAGKLRVRPPRPLGLGDESRHDLGALRGVLGIIQYPEQGGVQVLPLLRPQVHEALVDQPAQALGLGGLLRKPDGRGERPGFRQCGCPRLDRRAHRLVAQHPQEKQHERIGGAGRGRQECQRQHHDRQACSHAASEHPSLHSKRFQYATRGARVQRRRQRETGRMKKGRAIRPPALTISRPHGLKTQVAPSAPRARARDRRRDSGDRRGAARSLRLRYRGAR